MALRRSLLRSCKSGRARVRTGVEIRRRDFLEGTWAPFLLHAATLRFRYPCAQPSVAYG